jgi:hypothetical protein
MFSYAFGGQRLAIRAGASGARCTKTKERWDYVCVFKDGQGRRVMMGVMVDSRQLIEMSRW